MDLYAYVGNDPLNRSDPDGEDWVFDQSTGEMAYYPMNFATLPDVSNLQASFTMSGYAGYAEAANNPAMEGVSDVGPLPVGRYDIGQPFNNAHQTGPFSMRLTPDEANDMHGRSEFLIHGDNSKNDHTASHGCIILCRLDRERIDASDDRSLWVIGGARGNDDQARSQWNTANANATSRGLQKRFTQQGGSAASDGQNGTAAAAQAPQTFTCTGSRIVHHEGDLPC
jgi:hypothetical protein